MNKAEKQKVVNETIQVLKKKGLLKEYNGVNDSKNNLLKLLKNNFNQFKNQILPLKNNEEISLRAKGLVIKLEQKIEEVAKIISLIETEI